MNRYSLLLLVAALAACATTSVQEFKAPDGTSVKTVKCTSDPAKCFAVASQSCPNDGTYRVISSESHAGGIAADIIPGPVTWYAITYACGLSDGRIPDFKWVGPQYTSPPHPTTTNCTTIGNTVNCNTY